MDPWMIAAVVMLVVWAVGTFVFTAPGWLHFLLTLGVFLLIWRIVVRGTPSAPSAPGATPDGGAGGARGPNARR